MTRIYHTWDKWECYRAGFYANNPPNYIKAKEANERYCAFLRDSTVFAAALKRVITEWRYSCEHYLSNEHMNRIAWLGQAAMCIETGIPAAFRGGFNLLSETERQTANALALKYLNHWLTQRGESKVTMAEAGVATLAAAF